MYNYIQLSSIISKKTSVSFTLERLFNYSSSSFLFNLYFNSFHNSTFKQNDLLRNKLANLVSLNEFYFNDLDNKEFCCLFLLTFLNILIGFFPNIFFFLLIVILLILCFL